MPQTPKKVRSKTLIGKLRKHYRLVIMNDENFEIKTSIKLSRLNVLFILSVTTISFIFLFTSMVVFTPIKEYIPGYEFRDFLREELIQLKMNSDSLELIVATQSGYIDNLLRILRDEVDEVHTEQEPINPQRALLELGKRSIEDSILREELASREKFAVLTDGKPANRSYLSSMLLNLTPPVRGMITEKFNATRNHYGIDIVAQKNSTVKAVTDGVVIFSGWTVDDGHVIMIKHRSDLISVYKHNASLLMKVGNFVRSGDAVAIIGESGELAHGPHLHFELWHNLMPVDPTQFINLQ